MNEMTHDHATFRSMIDGTQQDWDIIAREQKEFAPNNGKRILEHLKLLVGAYGRIPGDSLQHCLQIPHRAHLHDRVEAYAVLALPHTPHQPVQALYEANVSAAELNNYTHQE